MQNGPMIDIRLAGISDAPGLAELNDLFYGEGSNTAGAIEESLRSNEDEIVCVAAEGSRLVGYCCGQIERTMCKSYKCGTVTDLYVIEEYRRQGAGRSLLEFIESEFDKRGAKHLHISTGTENTIAQTLYRSCGYADTSEFILDKDLP